MAGGDRESLFRKVLRSSRVDHSGERQALGRLPPIDALVEIWSKAQKCEDKGHSEAGWNCAVHYPLMELALKHSNITRNETEELSVDGAEILVDVVNA